jgi:hypothetical protein
VSLVLDAAVVIDGVAEWSKIPFVEAHRDAVWRTFVGRALAEASRLDHGSASVEHLLLALVAPGERSPAAQALHDCSVTYERCASAVSDAAAKPDASRRGGEDGVTSTPALHELLGRAQGLAAGLGAGAVRPEHMLIALLWDGRSQRLLARCGADREAVYRRLGDHGVKLPAASLPPAVPEPRGQHHRVEIPAERLRDALRRLPQLLAGTEWGWNTAGPGRARIDAFGDVDLDDAVAQALAEPPG